MESESSADDNEETPEISKANNPHAVRPCPGMSCPRFMGAAGATWEAKAEEACAACERCDAYPAAGAVEIETDEAEINYLIEEVESVIDEQNAFGTAAATVEDYEIYQLVIFYRKTKQEIEEIWKIRHQAFIKSHYQQQ